MSDFDMDRLNEQYRAQEKYKRTLEGTIEYFLEDGNTGYNDSPTGFWGKLFWAGWACARGWEKFKAPFQLFVNGWFQYRDEWMTKTPRDMDKRIKRGDYDD